MDIVGSNPLVRDRIPKRLPRHAPQVIGGHFNVSQENVVNDTGFLNIYRGQFRYKPDPHLELDFKIWEDDGSAMSAKIYINATTMEGFTPAMFKDFEIAEERKLIWKKDVAGRITFGGAQGGLRNPTHVIMFRSGQKRDEVMAKELRASDDIQKTAEQKAQERAEAISQGLGHTITPQFEWVNEDELRELEGEE